MTRAVAFLHGVYRRRDLPFYRALCRGRLTIAVDGGYRFFRMAGLFPDILLGDFDSLKRLPANLPPRTRVLRFPSRKDKTDAHLAIECCRERGLGAIDLVMPGLGEIDHALGVVFLLGLRDRPAARSGRADIRMVSPQCEIRLVADSRITYRRRGGDLVSVLPLSARIRLTTEGTEYDVTEAWLQFGDTRGLRNRIVRARATVAVRGQALVVRRFSGGLAARP
ncbi:MAG TPA: thiamine diphosphokinase [candidate division Zixibacteria bacterium]|nr:thiamine diphosphokinase [candidate division Zixibacteria bacterium]